MQGQSTEAKVLPEHPVAQSLHQDALDAAMAGNFSHAYELFDHATDILTRELPALHTGLQYARVIRDKARTSVRDAVKESDPRNRPHPPIIGAGSAGAGGYGPALGLLDEATDMLRNQAYKVTAPLASSTMMVGAGGQGEAGGRFIGGFEEPLYYRSDAIRYVRPMRKGIGFWVGAWRSNLSRSIAREILATHGSVVSSMARAATVRAFVFKGRQQRQAEGDGRDGESGSSAVSSPETVWYRPKVEIGETAHTAEHLYTIAHRALHIGNNGFHLVDNAIAAARHERAQARFFHLHVPGHRFWTDFSPDSPSGTTWLSRASSGLAWTALHDSRNVGSALGIMSDRLLDLRSGRAALASVRRWQ